MALILNIDCATNNASVGFSENEEVIALRMSSEQKEHASFVQVAINSLINETSIALKNIDAVAVTAGPGSYTGLRVGLASAKGICYALNKPLITLNTLEVMTQGAINLLTRQEDYNSSALFCPMIDARRMEVFTALYTNNFKIISPPCAIEINNTSFKNALETDIIYFFGSGSEKCKEVLSAENAVFLKAEYNVREVAFFSNKAFDLKQFTNIAYSEPLYLKEFYSTYKS